jgi:acetyl esterase/lipase
MAALASVTAAGQDDPHACEIRSLQRTTLRQLTQGPSPCELVYKHTSFGDLRLYEFKPADGGSGKGQLAVLWIHGGGWTGGTSESIFPLARYTASRGAVSFVVDYRLVTPGRITVADAVGDCRSAVRFVRGHAAQLGIDPNKIAVVGESAGGHLAASVATLEEINDPSDHLTISARPDALLLYNPITDFTSVGPLAKVLEEVAPRSAGNSAPYTPDARRLEAARRLSPVSHVRAGLPPTIEIHGLADTVVSPEQSRSFAKAMRDAGNRCDLLLLPEAPHAFLIPNYKCSEEVVGQALRLGDKFLASLGYLSGRPTLMQSDPPAWRPRVNCGSIAQPKAE